MSWTTLVAVYGAIVATGGAVWQVWTRARRPRPRIRMEIRESARPSIDQELAGRLVYHVTVAAINAGVTTETVEAIGFEFPEIGRGWDDREIAEPLVPGGVVTRTIPVRGLDFANRGVIRPYVELASQRNRIVGTDHTIDHVFVAEKCWPISGSDVGTHLPY